MNQEKKLHYKGQVTKKKLNGEKKNSLTLHESISLFTLFNTWLVTLTWTTWGLFGLPYFSLFIDVSTCDMMYHLGEFMKTTL
jgi:hypothetical protein